MWLAGQSAGLGGNYRAPRQLIPPVKQTREKQTAQPLKQESGKQIAPFVASETNPSQTTTSSDGIAGSQTATSQVSLPSVLPNTKKPDFKLSPPALIAILAAIPFVVALALFFAWLVARFNFVFIDLLVRRDIRIRESFRAHKALGNSYFLWSLGFMLVTILTIGVGIAALVFAFSKVKLLLWLLIPLNVLFFVAFIVVGLLVRDFVLPIMYRESIKTTEAFKKLFSFKLGAGQIAFYFLVKLGLGILAGLAALVAALIIGIAAFIIGLVLVLLGGLLIGALPVLKPILLALAIVGLIIGLLAIVILLGFATLPIPIFFGAFTLNYLARLIPPYNLLSFPTADSPSASRPA